MRVKSNGDCHKLVHEDSTEYAVGIAHTGEKWIVRLTVVKVYGADAGEKLRSGPLEFCIPVDAAIVLHGELGSQIELLRTLQSAHDGRALELQKLDSSMNGGSLPN